MQHATSKLVCKLQEKHIVSTIKLARNPVRLADLISIKLYMQRWTLRDIMLIGMHDLCKSYRVAQSSN